MIDDQNLRTWALKHLSSREIDIFVKVESENDGNGIRDNDVVANMQVEKAELELVI